MFWHLYAEEQTAGRCPMVLSTSSQDDLRPSYPMSRRAGGGQLDAAHAAADQLDANLVFEIADLAAERRLRRVQPFLGRERQAALFGGRDEKAKGPELHGRLPYLQGMPSSLQSILSGRHGHYMALQRKHLRFPRVL